MIKGILFDKDGTLLDFNATWLSSYFKATEYIATVVGRPEIAESLLRRGGYNIETAEWETDSLLASGSNDQIFEFWGEQIGRPLSETEISEIRKIFSHAANHYVPAIEDMRGFLESLKNKNLKLGLATMDDESHAHGMLSKLQLNECFDFVCGADSGFGVKPEPGMVDAFCQECHLAPDQIFMVGDSPKDINMGINAGVANSIGVLTGAHNRSELEKYTQTVLEDISGLEALLTMNS